MHESRARARVYASLLIAGLVCCATAGCAGKSSSKLDPAAIKQYADRGYAPDHRYETTSIQDTWTVGSEVVDVVLLAPSPPGTYPLVVYLPGLGESPDAGLSWRQAWARAGYAVLSAQPVRYGKAVWSSSAARAGEFFAIAKDAFAVRSLATRAHLVQGILDQASRRQRDARTPAFARIDLSRIAVTGYDLGAQTAMIVAGESVQGVEPLQLSHGVQCVVVLSPYADFSGMGMESNFISIRLPVLSVTSPVDTDAYGLVTSAAIRRAPFQYMPPGQKSLLLLSSAPHSVLAGAAPPGQRKDNDGTKSAPALVDETGPDARIVSEETAETTGETYDKKRRKAETSVSRGGQSAQRVKEQTQVQAVTTAYLDAIVKGDPLASEWLSRNAKGWLGESADLLSK
jgi:predicted dienelactone hydrolase